MKKEEKTERTKEKIMAAAMEEFGSKGYAGATLNNICKCGISKGLIYHNFKNKDEVYLACVDRCFTVLIRYLKKEFSGLELHEYLEVRFAFFSSHEYYARIFFEALLQPPEHLETSIKAVKKEFDILNRNIYLKALQSMDLRDGITEQEALAYFEVMQEMFNGYFSSPAYKGGDLADIITEHEEKLKRALEFMLYGIVKEEDKKK